MSALAHIALLGWIPAVLMLFALLPPRRAVIAAFVLGWLFMPMAGYKIGGLPDYDKLTATSYGVLLGIIIFDMGRLMRYRLSVVDLPIMLFCALAFVSSVTAGLGAYDGASATFSRIIAWGVPYLVGRLYFSNLEGLRELAIGLLIGGMIYVPFCLWEVRMSPRLHSIIYGFHQHSFRQGMRYGGYRPSVFLQHGLAVALWMCVTSLIGVWLWRTKALRKLFNLPMSVIVPTLLGTAVLCKTVGALVLLAGGLGLLYSTRWLKSAVLFLVVLVAVPGYLAARIGLEWQGRELIHVADALDPDRAESLEMRLINEDILTDRAKVKLLFGWGAGSGFRTIDDADRIVTDSMWIIMFGQGGITTLAAMVTVILLPVAILARRTRLRGWHRPELAPAAALAALLVIFMIDSLFNAMLNPIYLLAAGGLSAVQINRTMREGSTWGE